MEQVLTFLQDYGITSSIVILIIILGVKYIPKFLDLKLKQSEEKNYMIDTMKSVIENNSQVVNNNSEVIKLNSITIKNYTDNAHKLEDNMKNLITEINKVQEENKTTIDKISMNLEILKDRRENK